MKNLSVRIAPKLDLTNAEIDNISTTAILHDIGKIGISIEILNKNGSLTDAEYKIVMEHPMSLKLILDEIDDFNVVSELAYSHHEHYDGLGYKGFNW